MLSSEQKKMILNHLRRPENDLTISEIAGQIAQEFNKVGGNVNLSGVEQTAILMNIGETDERIAYIYAEGYSWKEHPKAIDSNKLHGEYSVEMAEKFGIELSDEQKQVIAGHSKGMYETPMAQIIKIAEVCRATEFPRWYRGEKKEPATNWKEVSDVLKEDPNISVGMIEHAKNSYGRRFKTKEEVSIEKDT